MASLLRLKRRREATRPSVGDRRVVTLYLLWPMMLGGEWRWLGRERVVQEFQSYWVMPRGMPGVKVVGWRCVDWADG